MGSHLVGLTFFIPSKNETRNATDVPLVTTSRKTLTTVSADPAAFHFVIRLTTKIKMNDAPKEFNAALDHTSFSYLSAIELEALHRLVTASGDAVIQSLLTTGTVEQQRLAAQGFMARELTDLRL
ncbi:hypothetical protein PInf_021712 [Phytophthora infestans]|nr:hypothetical protein PInf_021712 [Phytophthora infestans]